MKLRYVLVLAVVLVAALMFMRPEPKETSPEKAPADVVGEKTAAEKPAVTPEQTQTPAPYAISCKHLSEMLAKCEPYSCEMPHPKVKEFVVKHTVAGELPNSLCVHTQTAPGDMLVVCNYSKEMRLLVAKNLRTEKSDPITDDERKIMSAGFDAECEVVDTKNGEIVKRTLDGAPVERQAKPVPETEEKPHDDGTAKDLP